MQDNISFQMGILLCIDFNEICMKIFVDFKTIAVLLLEFEWFSK